MKGVDIIEITITSKMQIYPTNEQIEILNTTMFQIRKALNYISKYIFDNNCLNLKQGTSTEIDELFESNIWESIVYFEKPISHTSRGFTFQYFDSEIVIRPKIIGNQSLFSQNYKLSK